MLTNDVNSFENPGPGWLISVFLTEILLKGNILSQAIHLMETIFWIPVRILGQKGHSKTRAIGERGPSSRQHNFQLKEAPIKWETNPSC